MNYTGVELYRGPSLIDGEEVVVILTFHSKNEKTGDMAQTWILRADMAPQQAVKMGADQSVCGMCDHRHFLGGACYVIPFQAPNNVWRAWKGGSYPVATSRDYRRLQGRGVRFGAYGDPAAAPVEVWQRLAKVARFTTGYTHQAANLRGERLDLLDHCMVSVDNEAEALFYRSMKARTFRVKRPDEPLLEGEVYCPADTDRGYQCLDCGLCSGAYGKGKSVAINVHGQRQRRFDPIPVTEVA